MDKKQLEKLKREVSKRWPDIRNEVIHGQLEYILQEAGILVKPRKKRLTRAGEFPDQKITA